MNKWWYLVGFGVANLLGVGLLTFADLPVLRIIGWLWVSAAITFAGIVSVGGVSPD